MGLEGKRYWRVCAQRATLNPNGGEAWQSHASCTSSLHSFAADLYQVAEAAKQLQGQAGNDHVGDAQVAMTHNLGGMSSTAIADLLGIG